MWAGRDVPGHVADPIGLAEKSRLLNVGFATSNTVLHAIAYHAMLGTEDDARIMIAPELLEHQENTRSGQAGNWSRTVWPLQAELIVP